MIQLLHYFSREFCMKKRVLALTLALTMVYLCGCAKDNAKTESELASEESKIEQTITESKEETVSSSEELSSSEVTSSDEATSSEKVTSSEESVSSQKVTSSKESVSSEKITSSKKPISSKGTSSKKTSSKKASSKTQSTTSSQTQKPVEIDYDTVVEVDLCDEIVRAYLDADDLYNQYYWLSTYSGQKFDYQNLNLYWSNDDSSEYKVYFSQNADFSNALVYTVNYSHQLKKVTLIPGKTYYWKVVGNVNSEPINGGKIKVADAPVRWIEIDGVHNFRDMGGWKTTSGKTIKYGMLYRGPQLNTEKNDEIINVVSDLGLQTFNSLGIKTEFDLRSMQNVHVQTEGTNLNYVLLSDEKSAYTGYTGISGEAQKAKYIKMFEYLSDSSNYPIYAHCQGGADRTATYAFLLNGLLGVSYEDLTRDFELTSFAGTPRWRSAGSNGTFSPNDEDYVSNTITIKWRALYNYIMDYGKANDCNTLEKSIEHWFVNYVGVPKSQIDSFKSIMLE